MVRSGHTYRHLGVRLLLQRCWRYDAVVLHQEALLVEASGTHSNDSATKNVSIFFGIKAFGTLLTAYFSGYALKYLTKEQGKQ